MVHAACLLELLIRVRRTDTAMTWSLLPFPSDRPDAWNAGCQLPEAAAANGSLTEFGSTAIHASAKACACSLPGPPFQLSLLHLYWGPQASHWALPRFFTNRVARELNGKICYFKLVVKRATSGTCRTLRHAEIINSLLRILP